MPEGIEVLISANLIKPLLINKQIGKISIGNKSRYAIEPPEGYTSFNDSFRKCENITYVVSPCKILDVNVKGKFLYWSFDNGWYMFSTFGMSGQWSPIIGKHMCLGFRLHDPINSAELSYMYFNDPRHFGTIKFTNDKQVLLEKLGNLGWDPLKENEIIPIDWVHKKINSQNKPIAQVLLDQSIFAGVGNYLRAEALYDAKISPWKLCNTFTIDQTKSLCLSIIKVMEESYLHQGATLHTYKDAYGNEGKYSSCFKVYSKKNDPTGNLIKRENTPEGRIIHWCPIIQTVC